MNDHFGTMASACGDADALITYLYGESTEEERERIEAHLVQCATCAEEIATLGATREHLAAWTPPDRALGFQITQAAADRTAGGTVVPFASAQGPATTLGEGPAFGVGHQQPSRWWHQPLPAWAQLAAAVAIFASGLAIGAARHLSTPASAVTASTSAATATKTAATSATTSGTVSREDLAQAEARLHSEIAQLQNGSHAEGVSLQRVNGLIADSEARQRKELDYRTSVIVTDFQNARQYDNNKFGLQLQQTKGVTQANTQNINTLARQVGWSPNASPYVP